MKTKKLWKLSESGRIERAHKENIYNSFGKGCDESIALNFDRSSGKNCSTRCRHHKQSIRKNATFACYSTTSESFRPSVRDSLEKKGKMSPLEIVGLALIQLGELEVFLEKTGKRLKFHRFSAAGSVPKKSDIPVHERKRFENILRLLCSRLVKLGVAVHFPVESREKFEYYNAIVGDLVTIRLSLQDSESELSELRPCSFVVGEQFRSHNCKSVKLTRIEYARERARERYLKTGRKTIVCPAIVSTFLKKAPIHCGTCDACANKNIDVIYPLHV